MISSWPCNMQTIKHIQACIHNHDLLKVWRTVYSLYTFMFSLFVHCTHILSYSHGQVCLYISSFYRLSVDRMWIDCWLINSYICIWTVVEVLNYFYFYFRPVYKCTSIKVQKNWQEWKRYLNPAQNTKQNKTRTDRAQNTKHWCWPSKPWKVWYLHTSKAWLNLTTLVVHFRDQPTQGCWQNRR